MRVFVFFLQIIIIFIFKNKKQKVYLNYTSSAYFSYLLHVEVNYGTLLRVFHP